MKHISEPAIFKIIAITITIVVNLYFGVDSELLTKHIEAVNLEKLNLMVVLQ